MADSFRIRRGDGLVQITDPHSFAEAGRWYALSTAGAAPSIDLDTSEDESAASISEEAIAADGEDDGAQSPGTGPPPHAFPQEIQDAQERMALRGVRHRKSDD